MSKTAFIKVVKNEAHSRHPNLPAFSIGWDGKTVASSAVAYFVEEALCNPRQRMQTKELFERAKVADSGVVDLYSGNGPIVNSDGRYIFFDNDYFPEKKALLNADEFNRFEIWVQELKAIGFPNIDADYPQLEFNYIAEGSNAEKEFLLATGHR